jgi:hypothetical protein
MPVLEDIYIQEMDRATSKLEVIRINPTRKFMKVPLAPDGHWIGSPALYWWQNGCWFDTGGNPLAESEVPPEFVAEIAANPVTVTQLAGPAVTAVCRFCHTKMNQSEMEAHLIEHMNATLKAAGSIAADDVPPPVSSTPPPEKSDANRHRS